MSENELKPQPVPLPPARKSRSAGAIAALAVVAAVAFCTWHWYATRENLRMIQHDAALRVVAGAVQVAGRCDQRGIRFIDAPVTGRPPKLTIFAGSDHELPAPLVEVFGSYSAKVVHTGPNGTGSAMKLANQMLSARVESSQIYKPGEKIEVRFRVGLSSIFDAQSGERL